MTLDEARQLIGNLVVYHPTHRESVEQGVVTSVNDYYVFVRYGADAHSKATPAGMLSALIGNADHDSSREVCEQCGHSWDDHTEMFTDTEVWYQCPPSGTLFYETEATP